MEKPEANTLLDALLQDAQYAYDVADGDYSEWVEYSETEETRQ